MTNEELQKLLTSFEQEVSHIKQWEIDRNVQLKSVCSAGGKAGVIIMNQKNKINGHFEKLTKNKIGKKRSIDTVNKIKEGSKHSWKSVLQFTKDGEFIKEWPNFTAIRDELGYAHTNICACCKNNPKHKTSYGFIWKYKS